jgi:hypothetical protein
VVYHYLFARHKRDDRAINAMVDRAEKVVAGKRPLKKDRSVHIDPAGKDVDWDVVERARQLAGLKGYADLRIMPTCSLETVAAHGYPAEEVGIIRLAAPLRSRFAAG